MIDQKVRYHKKSFCYYHFPTSPLFPKTKKSPLSPAEASAEEGSRRVRNTCVTPPLLFLGGDAQKHSEAVLLSWGG